MESITEPRKKNLQKPLSKSFLLTGNEAPISKTMKPTQIHADYQVLPFRLTDKLMVNGALPRLDPQPLEQALQNLKFLKQTTPRHQQSPEFTNSPLMTTSTATQSSKGNEGFNTHTSSTNRVLVRPSGLKSEFSRHQTEPKQKLGASVVRPIVTEPMRSTQSNLEKGLSSSITIDMSFVPYTLNDYRNFQLMAKRRLGGLGPVHVGSQIWQEKMDMKKKMLEYSQKLTLPKLNGGDRSKSVPKIKSLFG